WRRSAAASPPLSQSGCRASLRKTNRRLITVIDGMAAFSLPCRFLLGTIEGVTDGRSDRLLYEPAIARPRDPLDAGRTGPALSHRDPRLRDDAEGTGLSRHQPDGQGAGAEARRYRHHRSRGDLHLSRRRLSGSQPRAAAHQQAARALLSL